MDFSTVTEKIKEQEWYQQIQSSYQQLPADQQSYVKWGLLGGGTLLWVYLIFTVAVSAGGLRREFQEKRDLVRIVNDASEELRKIRGQGGFVPAAGGDQNWKSILGSLISTQGLPADSLEIVSETPGAAENLIQETLLELKIKSVGTRQLVQILTQIHQGSPPMKLKGLLIETGEGEGQLNAKLNVSGYLAKGEKTK